MLRASTPAVGAVVALLTLALAGCAGGAASAPPATPIPPAATPGATAAGPRVIEDAGIEVALPAGTYTSRLFQPSLRLELEAGWYRRDANGDRNLNLRRVGALGTFVAFNSAPDFIQCGDRDAISKPNGTAILAELAASVVPTGEPVEFAVGSLTGMAIELLGTGEPVEEADFGPASGCMVTLGAAPFPDANSQVLPLLRDAAMLLVLVEVGGTTVMIRTGADEDRAAWYDFFREAATGFHLG